MKLLLYCTKAKPNIVKGLDNKFYISNAFKEEGIDDYKLNGKIVAECDFEVEEINYRSAKFVCNRYYLEILKKSCLTDKQMYDYLKGEKGYAIHIKNLHIFDEPKFIQDYSTNENPYNYIENAPRNMMYAYDVKSFENYEKNILISIRPEWLCKILNGEKTIEIRKKVLRGMLDE